ncbi:hypothetical protein VCHA35P150_20421 [Vibrio chagasii]|nr:hypothetical protein VCHA35P150_20421 [Vibrio chagasii]CAH6904721.1 hypothetical protein VCHA56P515_100030 [Vibrio chagasii]
MPTLYDIARRSRVLFQYPTIIKTSYNSLYTNRLFSHASPKP